MYIWRIEGLKGQLAARALSDREVLPYFVASSSMFGLGLAIPPSNPNGWDTVLGLAIALLTVLGTLWGYRQNGGQSGREFLPRFVAIGWVSSLRLLPAVLLAILVLFIIAGAPLEGTPQTSPFDVFVFAGLTVVYYQRVGAHVRQVARGLPNQPLEPTSGGGVTVADSKV